MSEIIFTPEAERKTLERKFQAVDVSLDGRNVEMLCAPFDARAMVADPPPFGNGIPYEEEFAHGAFVSATKDPQRVLLDFEHQTTMAGILGRGSSFEETNDGLLGHFRVLEHSDGDKALELIREGVLKAASVYFKPMKTERTASGVMRRLKVRLENVALCRVGAYPEAQVLAVRTESVVPETEPVLPFDPELAEFLSARGIAVPERLRSAK